MRYAWCSSGALGAPGFATPIWLSLLMAWPLYMAQHSNAATLSLKDPVRLGRVTRNDITGAIGGGGQRNVNVGNYSAPPQSPPYNLVLPEASFPGVNTVFQRSNNNTWQLDFANNEWPDPINVSVVVEVLGGVLVDPVDSGSVVAISGSSFGIQERRRNNGSLRWVRGSTLYDINIQNVRSDNRHQGSLRITVTYN